MSASPLFMSNMVIVGIGEMAVSADPAVQIVTYALGSCLGICVHDPVAHVGGLLHVMLPSSTVCQAVVGERLERYVDTGVPALFRSLYALGAAKQRMVVKVAGGSRTTDADSFEIGKRNVLALRKLLWKNNVMIDSQEIGGLRISRTMCLDVGSGEVTLRVGMERRTL